MGTEKLGQAPAFGFGYEKLRSYQTQSGDYRTPEKELGMSKRFYAACMALQGILANSSIQVTVKSARDYAEMAYDFADELLKQE